jgi:hypothetical protein
MSRFCGPALRGIGLLRPRYCPAEDATHKTGEPGTHWRQAQQDRQDVAGYRRIRLASPNHTARAAEIVCREPRAATVMTVPRQARLPISTIRAAEYLVQIGDRQRLRDWLGKHSRIERKALKKYFARKNSRIGNNDE